MNNTYIEGSRKGKIRLLVLITALIFLYFLHKYAWSVYVPIINGSDATEFQLKEYAKTVSIFSTISTGMEFLIFLYAAYFSYKFGKLVQLNMQYPPPGALMPFTTKIVRGNKAINQARAFYALSVLIIAYGVLKVGVSIYVVSNLSEVVDGF
jgi:hypothetical protein